MIWCGVVWRGVAWRGVAWRGVAWRGVAWRGVAWRGVAWRGVAWRGVAWRGVAWRGMAWHGFVLYQLSTTYPLFLMWRFDLPTREPILSANTVYVRLLRLATIVRGGTLVGHAHLGFLLLWDR